MNHLHIVFPHAFVFLSVLLLVYFRLDMSLDFVTNAICQDRYDEANLAMHVTSSSSPTNFAPDAPDPSYPKRSPHSMMLESDAVECKIQISTERNISEMNV